jgi:hypothetical protein
MAISKVGTYRNPPEDITDYQAISAHLNAYTRQLGSQAMILTEWTNTTGTPSIAMGSYISHGGVLYIAQSEEAIALPVADGTYYLKVEASGDTLVLSWISNLSGYSWNAIANGLYHADESQVLGYQLVVAGAVVEKWKITNLMQGSGFNVVNYLGETSTEEIEVTLSEVAVGSLVPRRKTGPDGVLTDEFHTPYNISIALQIKVRFISEKRFVVQDRQLNGYWYLTLYEYKNGSVVKYGSSYGPYSTDSNFPGEVIPYDENKFILSIENSRNILVMQASTSGLSLIHTVDIAGVDIIRKTMDWFDMDEKILGILICGTDKVNTLKAYQWNGSSTFTLLATKIIPGGNVVTITYARAVSNGRNSLHIFGFRYDGGAVGRYILNLTYNVSSGYYINDTEDILDYRGSLDQVIYRFINNSLYLTKDGTGIFNFDLGSEICGWPVYSTNPALGSNELLRDISDSGNGLAIIQNYTTKKLFIVKFEYGKLI